MRLLTRADVDLAATLALCTRMGNAGRVLRHLRDRFEDPQADAQAVFEYGLCRAMFLLNDPNDSDKGPHQVAAAQAFSRCVEIDAGWWLPRFLRMEINSVLARAVPDPAGEPPGHDLAELLLLQAGAPQSPPYFLSTHAARLRARLRTDPASAVEAVEEFAAAASAVGVAPSALRLPYLDLPFRESVLLLRQAGRAAAADSIKATGLAIYPGSQPLQLA